MHLEGKLNSYDKKKYVCKMLYMYILGWELDFGHVEAFNLISGNKYTEKQIVGFFFLSFLFLSFFLSSSSSSFSFDLHTLLNIAGLLGSELTAL